MRTRAREIDADILLQRRRQPRAAMAPNKADPPKATRSGKHAPRAQAACSVCGGEKRKGGFLHWFYDQETGALVCGRCAMPSGTRNRQEPSVDKVAHRLAS